MKDKANISQDIKIRIAALDDYRAIAKIQREDGFKHAYLLTEERFKRLLGRGELFLIAHMGDNAVGIISIDIEFRAKIHFLSVMKSYQKRGIGSTLLKEAFKEIKDKGVEVVYVYVETSSPAEQFLLQSGFDKVGVYQNRYGEGKNANILELRI